MSCAGPVARQPARYRRRELRARRHRTANGGAQCGSVSRLRHRVSGGSHMAYRLALEVPEEVPAVTAIGASLPVQEEIDCRPSGKPVSVMIVNGTADPVNPYEGGEVVAPTGSHLGQVRSSRRSGEYFARLVGHDPARCHHAIRAARALHGRRGSDLERGHRWCDRALHDPRRRSYDTGATKPLARFPRRKRAAVQRVGADR